MKPIQNPKQLLFTKPNPKILLLAVALLLLTGCSSIQTNITSELETLKQPPVFLDPIPDFQQRVTLKRYGTYVEPENSPVDPERFKGFHTGIDIEYPEQEEISVKAIADGEVLLARTVSGYGGVMIIKHTINGQTYSVLYGHLDPESFTTEKEVQAGEQIAILGEAYSSETDGERKHLHFSIRPGQDTDLRGYVQSESELEGWLDPLQLLDS